MAFIALTYPFINHQISNGPQLARNFLDLTNGLSDGTKDLTIGTLTATNFSGTFSGTSSGTNTGDITLATVGSTPANAGASLSGQVLTLQPADGTHGGVISTTTQTIAGDKTFSGAISASNLSGTNTGNVTLAAIGSSPNANGATLSTQALNLEPASASFGGIVTTGTQTMAGAKTWSGAAAFSSTISQSSGTSAGVSLACSNNEFIMSLQGQDTTAGNTVQTEIVSKYNNATTRTITKILSTSTNATAASAGGRLTFFTSTTGGSATEGLSIREDQSVRFANITTTASAANAFLDNTDSNNLLRSTSSARYKKNIRDLELDSSRIFDLRPVEFDDKNRGTHHIGLVAEEVADIFPELVTYTKKRALDPLSDSDELVPDGVQYQLLSVMLLKEFRKLKQQLGALY